MATRPLRTLGRRVHELRAQLNLSQEKLAERAGLHRNLIGMIERGETNPTFTSLHRISHALGQTLSDLLRDM